MADSQISSFGSISDPVGVHMSQKVIYSTRKNMVYYRFAHEEEIPKGESTTIKFETWGELTPVVSPILGQITPQGEDLAPTYSDATLQQYGKWVPLNKYVLDTVRCSVLNHVNDRLGYNMRISFETLDFYTFRQGTNVFYSGTATGRDNVVAPLDLTAIENAVAEMEADNVEPITDMIHPVPEYGTVSVPECYMGTCHAYIARAIRNMPGFTPPKDYAAPEERLPMEVGMVAGVRFIQHNVAVPWAGSVGTVGAASASVKNTGGYADVYPVMIFGKDAIGMSKLEGTEFTKIIVNNPKPSDSDPLAQRGTAGWISWHAAKILDESRMARIECAASLTGVE